MSGEIHLGAGGIADPGVVIGYTPSRPVDTRLHLGPAYVLRSGTVIYLGSTIGARFQTGHNVVVREQAEIGDEVSVWSNTVIDYGVTLGDEVKVHSGCYVAQFSVIGSGAFLAPGVSLANDLYPGDEESADLMRGPTIGPRAQLGVNVTVLPYVSIGEGTIVGAGSVVTRDLPPGVIAFGNPARPHKALDERRPIRDRVGTPARASG
jgi:acetyltransferase-like isoleucine patch superfamily enzyme